MARLPSPKRRRLLQAVTGITFGLGMTATANAQEYEPSVTFEDQNTPGDTVTIAEIVTSESVVWRVHKGSTEYARGHFEGNQRLENKTIELENEIEVSDQIYCSIFPDGGGDALAYDDALITVENDSILGVNEIARDPDSGFHFPYFLYVPPTEGKWNANKPLLVHQNNSPSTSDDFSYHKKHARSKLDTPSGQISDELGIPLLVPVTPRPHEISDAQRLQAMSDRALRLKEEQLARIDLQIVRMIEHAQKRLDSNSHPVQNKVILNGYSGSGKFAQRFSMLHPGRVLSVTAGGLAGLPILPVTEAKGHVLNYYLGIADMMDLTGEQANPEAFGKIAHFYYEGAKDTTNFIPEDETHRDEMKDTALKVYGEDMVEDRVPFARETFQEAEIPIKYRIYEDNGHERAPVEDLIAFHEPYVPENTSEVTATPGEKSTTTTENVVDVTTTREQQTSVAADGLTTTSVESPTTSSEAPGLSLLSGLASVIGATYIGSRLLNSSDK